MHDQVGEGAARLFGEEGGSGGIEGVAPVVEPHPEPDGRHEQAEKHDPE
jgi:hypothetical protein